MSTNEWGPMTDQQRKAQCLLRMLGPRASGTVAIHLDITTDAAGKLLNRLAERGIVARRADGRWTA